MSEENMEVVRAGFDMWNAGDMDAYRELLHPEVSWRAPDDYPEPGPFVGRDAVGRQLEQLRATWGDGDRLEPIEDFIDAGDRVVVRVVWRGVGHGPDLNMELTDVYAVRDSRIFGIEFFRDHADALEAAGLSE